MADPSRRLSTNAPGPLYVDDTCIDCGTCRWMAPEVYDLVGAHSRVHTQPTEGTRLGAVQALLACPTHSIGTSDRTGVREASRSFPRPFADERVLHCGYHAESTFGASAWLLLRDDGNVLIDSPRFAAKLVRRLEELGGIRWMFLTHKDDIADHARFAAHFGCTRILHEADRDHRTADVEHLISGTAPRELAPGLTMVPTPGHTRGSVCLHAEDTWLFTGDTLAATTEGHLRIFEGATWYSHRHLRASMEVLAAYRFRWVLPGHGAPTEGEPEELARQLLALSTR